MTRDGRAIVVGSGPNGLAGAILLARAGLRVRVLEAAAEPGGGTRSSQLTLPGLIHDHCSAFHPMAQASPLFRELGLERYGLRWRHQDIEMAHPLDDGTAAAVWRDIDRTVDELGGDGPAWRYTFGALSAGFDDLAQDILRPLPHLPRHPMRLARFGPAALLPASVLVRQWRQPRTRALFGGAAAHAVTSLGAPLSSAVGLTLIAAAHRHGWPVAEGGSRAIATAMIRMLESLGGTVETDTPVTSIAQVDGADIVLLDTAPGAAATILGDRQPPRANRAYRRYRYGPGALKVDLAVRGPIPWANPLCARAGTVHLGGTFDDLADAEAATVRGHLAAAPFVLVGQQYLADRSRSVDGVHPIWAYAHVPHGYPGEDPEPVLRQIERFAPGFRDRIVDIRTRGPAALERDNPNYVGGDIAVGSNAGLRLLFRPGGATLPIGGRTPYDTGVPGVYLCSSATPPGGGVHGMGGANAAAVALARWELSRG
ncbi:phytoene desaturase family protein [Millisia brevis]|uniref:phytoene desaturase family protein n=1 Tax=Millisia brevis TaxID=264148 RepID=UPI00082D2580|nr:NAD(P)/FAD-dependent oxidoreductase [Millisia brevis]